MIRTQHYSCSPPTSLSLNRSKFWLASITALPITFQCAPLGRHVSISAARECDSNKMAIYLRVHRLPATWLPFLPLTVSNDKKRRGDLRS